MNAGLTQEDVAFQFTTSLRRLTNGSVSPVKIDCVSIHNLLTEVDCYAAASNTNTRRFNSQPPYGG